MTASDLSEWIAIFMMELQPDGAGGFAEAIPAGLVADRPANVRTPTPRVVVAGDQRADRVEYVITIRYEPGITSNYRVMWNDQFFDITGVKDVDTRRTWLELSCLRYEAGTQ
jgi:head-tail adaptor